MSEYELSLYFWSAVAVASVLTPLVITMAREAARVLAAHRCTHQLT